MSKYRYINVSERTDLMTLFQTPLTEFSFLKCADTDGDGSAGTDPTISINNRSHISKT